MNLEDTIPVKVAALTERLGKDYLFILGGRAKTSLLTDDAQRVSVKGVLMAQGATVQLRQHGKGSTAQTTAYRMYTADPHAEQITVSHAIHVDDTLSYKVQSVRRPLIHVTFWIISFSA